MFIINVCLNMFRASLCPKYFETEVNNKHLIVASCWYFYLHTLLTMHGHRNLKPTAGLTLLWARNPFSGNFNHWQVSQKEAGQVFCKRKHGSCGKSITI